MDLSKCVVCGARTTVTTRTEVVRGVPVEGIQSIDCLGCGCSVVDANMHDQNLFLTKKVLELHGVAWPLIRKESL